MGDMKNTTFPVRAVQLYQSIKFRIDESLKGLLDCFVHVDCSNKIRYYNLKIDKSGKIIPDLVLF